MNKNNFTDILFIYQQLSQVECKLHVLFPTLSPLPGIGKVPSKYLLNEYDVATFPGTHSLHNKLSYQSMWEWCYRKDQRTQSRQPEAGERGWAMENEFVRNRRKSTPADGTICVKDEHGMQGRQDGQGA